MSPLCPGCSRRVRRVLAADCSERAVVSGLRRVRLCPVSRCRFGSVRKVRPCTVSWGPVSGCSRAGH
eukprot:13628513-Alexandrium_andersonii.AAC.1